MFKHVIAIIFIILFFGCEQKSIDLFGIVKEDSRVYTENGSSSPKIKKDSRVMYFRDQTGCPTHPLGEKMIKIMLPNKYGDFVKGTVVCVEDKKIKWD